MKLISAYGHLAARLFITSKSQSCPYLSVKPGRRIFAPDFIYTRGNRDRKVLAAKRKDPPGGKTSFLKLFPFGLDFFQKLPKPVLLANVFQVRVIFLNIRIVDKAAVDRIFQPI